MITALAIALATAAPAPHDEFCIAFAEVGAAIIATHEANAPLEGLLERINKQREPLRSMMRKMALIVYAKPPKGFPYDATALKNKILVDCIVNMESER